MKRRNRKQQFQPPTRKPVLPGPPNAYYLTTKLPWCPLCQKKMEKKFIFERNKWVYCCFRTLMCHIAIAIDDPFVGKWEQLNELNGHVPCPRGGCGENMRYFSTSTGAMKAVCPRKTCGASITNINVDKQEGGGPKITLENPGALH